MKQELWNQVHVLYARSTAPERRQEVQTYACCGTPSTLTLTRLMLDFHILFVLLCE